MKEIFISYSTMDITQAETIRNILENNGFSCWMAPRDIPGGSNYTREIPVAIRNCKVFLLILSANSQKSPWVLKELDAAVNNSKIILPFMLESFDLNEEFNFLLTGTQRYTAYQKKAEAIEALLERIHAIVGVEHAAGECPAEVSEESETHVPVRLKTSQSSSAHSCPACHGDDLKLLKNSVKVEKPAEAFFLLIPVLLCLVCPFVTLMVLAVANATVEIALIGFVASVAIGILWGRQLAVRKVDQYRMRKGWKMQCFRCARCKKVFNIASELE